jgi:hypothetical protein
MKSEKQSEKVCGFVSADRSVPRFGNTINSNNFDNVFPGQMVGY